MRFRFVIVVIVVVIVAPIFVWIFCSHTLVVLVRHAEKSEGVGNVNLSPTGQQRATRLAQILSDAAVDAVYTSERCRTSGTGQPLAAARGLPIHVLDSTPEVDLLAACDPPIDVPIVRLAIDASDSPAIASHVRLNHPNRTVLVVGHSDTIPAIGDQLTNGLLQNFEIANTEFDHLLVVTAPTWLGAARVIRARY